MLYVETCIHSADSQAAVPLKFWSQSAKRDLTQANMLLILLFLCGSRGRQKNTGFVKS